MFDIIKSIYEKTYLEKATEYKYLGFVFTSNGLMTT